MALTVAVVPFVVAIPVAFAGVGVAVTPDFPSNATVGQTALPASIQILNDSTLPEASSNVDVNTINLVPACGVSFASGATGDCPAADADPGVFQVSSVGTGEAGTACAGTSFTTSIIDASTGQVSFTPSMPVVLGPANDSGASPVCRLDFTFNILKAPTKPAGSSPAGTVLTDQLASASAVSDGATGTSTGSSDVVVALAAPSITTKASGGGKLGKPTSDSATLAPANPKGPTPTGAITFNLYGPGTTCTTTAIYTKAVTVTGTKTYKSGAFTPTAPGTYEWVAAYSGDANNLATASACGTEPVTIKAPKG